MINEDGGSERLLQDQFLIPQSVQSLIDTTPSGLFSMVNQAGLIEVSANELEIGFRKLKQTLDQRNMDYKVLLFDIDTPSNQEDEVEKEANEIRLGLSAESLAAKPLLKADFIERLNSILNDRGMSEKIALGCQQAASSACFVHFWAFNALWITLNCRKDDADKKLTMK